MRKKGNNAVRVLVDSRRHVAFVPAIEIETGKAVLAINLANYIPVPPGSAEPTDFTGDPSEFADFIRRHFPGDRFAPLRRVMDKPSPLGWGFQRKMRSAVFRSHPFAMLYRDEWRATPISFYREIVRVGKLLRAAAVFTEAIAQLKGECPALRLCDCGNFFVPQRKDKETCSDTCADRVRKAKWRNPTQEQRDRYKKNRILRENEKQNRKAG